MADVTSKNMYALLGNDPEQDSDREPEPPTKTVDKTAARSGKRTGPEGAPARASHPERGGRSARARVTGSEAAFQRGVDSNGNRRQGIPDDVNVDRRGRGGRGGRLRRADGGQGPRGHRDDRHSRGLPDHPKQGDAAWGANTGEAELNDEQAGDAIASQEAKREFGDQGPDGPVDADGNPLNKEDEEPEEKQKSYAEYLAEQAAKKLNLGGSLKVREANEGTKDNKKWASKALDHNKVDEAYIAPTASKAKREKVVKERQVVDIDHSWNESSSSRGDRGGRGHGRGEFRGERRGRGRGEGRGEFRARGEGRGEYRGRGSGRGGRGGAGQVNVTDQTAFPSLGS